MSGAAFSEINVDFISADGHSALHRLTLAALLFGCVVNNVGLSGPL